MCFKKVNGYNHKEIEEPDFPYPDMEEIYINENDKQKILNLKKKYPLIIYWEKLCDNIGSINESLNELFDEYFNEYKKCPKCIK
jgi:hypothetical protein